VKRSGETSNRVKRSGETSNGVKRVASGEWRVCRFYCAFFLKTKSKNGQHVDRY
jgi:hypothetical protein